MALFSSIETTEIDRIWRSLPAEHVWSGWASVGQEPEAIWLYRRRQNWRRFQLLKKAGEYLLVDEKGEKIAASGSLPDVLCDIEIVPSLARP